MDEYRYIKLTREDMDIFGPLDPYEKLRLLYRANGFAMGVVGEEGDNLYSIGLMCGQLLDDTVSLEWIIVEPEHRGEGIGEELLVRAFELAKAYGASVVTALIPEEFNRETALRNAATFFEERLFTKRQRIGADFEFTVSELERSPVIKGSSEKEGLTVSTQKIQKTEEEKIFSSLKAIENASFSVDIDMVRHELDKDLSVIVKNDKRIEGAILIQRAGDTLIPVYLYARSEKIRYALIKASLAEAERKYDKKQLVSVSLRQEETKELIGELFGSAEEALLLAASVKEYEKEVSED